MRVLVLIVAYNAQRHIRQVLERLRPALSDRLHALVLDDASTDLTAAECEAWRSQTGAQLAVERNPVNLGYGGNQKKGFRYALAHGYDIVALLHGDGQYPPERIGDLIIPIANGESDAVIASRMQRKSEARQGGMPLYKMAGNMALTAFQNVLLGTRLTEYHSGLRAYRASALAQLPFEANSDYFTFDAEILIQLIDNGYRLSEISIGTHYGDEICHVNSLRYAAGVISATLLSRLQKRGLWKSRKFDYKHI